MKKKTIFKCTAILCAVVSVAALAQTVRIGYEYRQGENKYGDLADIMVSPVNSSIYVSESASGEAPIDVDFPALNAMNANVVGWLYCAGTPINYPVVQSDDNSYYLNRLYDGQKNSSGAIFMDAMNATDLSDANTIFYGHNMKNGTMFASLANYGSQSYYEAHPVIYYLTKDRKYRIDVFASYETPGGSEAFTIFFDSEKTYSDYLQQRWHLSQIDTSQLPMSADDNIVTLSTCSYNYNDARYVVQGKVTPLD